MSNFAYRTNYCLMLLLVFALSSVSALVQTLASKPNIVLMLTDNVGYGELGVYGGGILRGAPTPRIDKLASEGMRLLNFNVEAQCTPSRSALMTGRFPSALAHTKSRLAAFRTG